MEDPRGKLVPIEAEDSLPFEVRRTYYIYDIPSDTVRGGHAHRVCEEFIVAATGAFRVSLSDGSESKEVNLEDPSVGLYVPAMTWRVLDQFAAESVCLVFSSLPYDEADYYRDFDSFKSAL